MTNDVLGTVLLQAGGTSAIMQFLPLIAVVVVIYFFMMRPQIRRQKELKAFRDNLAKGDKVITGGGIFCKVIEISDLSVIVQVEGETTRLKVDKFSLVKDTTDIAQVK